MRFMLTVIEGFLPGGVRDNEAGSASTDEQAAIEAFDAGLERDGSLVLACGLGSPSTAIVLDGRDGRHDIVPGPFLTGDEHLGGFWIINAPDGDIALGLGRDASRACNRRVEVRPLL